MKTLPIDIIQGPGPLSPHAGSTVRTRGTVTGISKRGFFIQDPAVVHRDRSCAIFVYSPREKPRVGLGVEVRGKVVDFVRENADRPTTQLQADRIEVVSQSPDVPAPVWLTAAFLRKDNQELARALNALEGMLVGIEEGAVFVAPSNPFGDYVVAPEGMDVTWSASGGVMVDPARPERWLPSFRILAPLKAPLVNVGAVLRSPVIGPLNYRVGAFQIACLANVRIEPRDVPATVTTLESTPDSVRILTLNGFNLDPHVERAAFVKDPRMDIDDDVGDGRYRRLGGVIARDAAAPEIVALQEMQDDDGAEITATVDARTNYEKLIACVANAGGPTYSWCDIPPEAGADGGQPGGNIRNGFLYDPERVSLVDGSLKRIGTKDAAFADSRKPLVAVFERGDGSGRLAVFNVHLASKRHQHSIFAPEQPGFDPRLATRVEQARCVREAVLALMSAGLDVYVTGDFNDFEFSETLQTLAGDDLVNLVERVPRESRYDYNHRGQSQALMHGLVGTTHAAASQMDYEILHGNELSGAQPGVMGDKATDHAYVIARIGWR